MQELAGETIQECLKSNITNPDAYFIFLSDVVAKTWAEWCITENHTQVKAVALERFTAWDKFKAQFISAKLKDKNAIPSLLRKLFIQDFIQKNAEKDAGDNTKLKKIIPPEMNGNSDAFTDWLSKILPSLNLWKAKLEQNKETYGALDEEDSDYLNIYNSYRNFLEKNLLFEPSWTGALDIQDSQKKFFIFYPEQFEDYADFEEILADAPNVSLVTLGQNLPSPKAYFYPDSRKELRQTILQIIELIKNKSARWEEIALTVPNLAVYRSYLERELELYKVPFVIRAGIPFTKNCAGKIFSEINECYKNDFSFDSLRSLLLDETLPWKKQVTLSLKHEDKTEEKLTFELQPVKEALIRDGNKMRCITSFQDGVDIWERSLNKLYYKTANDSSEKNQKKSLLLKQEIALYRGIKSCVRDFFENKKEEKDLPVTFKKVKKAWGDFRRLFMDDADFSLQADAILGRCISELDDIIQIETDFIQANDIKIKNPFAFFLNELEQKTYTPQQSQTGISIFPYTLSASAYFKYQFVIDASQKNLEVPGKRLAFLNSEKRRKLGLEKEDVFINRTNVFIQLYARKNDEAAGENSQTDYVHFSCAEDTFAGFAIPHCALDAANDVPNLDTEDFILQEKNWLKKAAENNSDLQPEISLTKEQKQSLEHWQKTAHTTEALVFYNNQEINQKIDYILRKARNERISAIKYCECENSEVNAYNKIKAELNQAAISGENAAKYKISARGDLEKFFPCQRKWLYSSILKLRDDSLDVELMTSSEIGSMYHKILELFMNQYLGKTLPVYDKEKDSFFSPEAQNFSDGVPEEQELSFQIKNQLEELTGTAIKHSSMNFCNSPLVIQTLLVQKQTIAENVYNFFKTLFIPFASNTKADGSITEMSGIGNCTVFGVEGTYAAPSNEYLYFGTVDCLLKAPLPYNSWIVIDYKQTKSAFPKEVYTDVDDKISDFQMPLYFKIISEGSKKEICAGYFYAVKDGEKKAVVDEFKTPRGFSDVISFENYKPTMQTFEEYCRQFCANVQTENFFPKSSNDEKDKQNVMLSENCAGCNFKGICRTTYSVAQNLLEKRESIFPAIGNFLGEE